ncbi:MAG: glycosyltransferase [Candidatus Latescibacterota bacterium]|nr:glycosyltransferase [Candidatus Latescibacterota bacterium]
MTNIVYVIPRPEIGGAEKQLLRLIENLDRDRFQPTIIFLDGKGSLLEEFRAAAHKIIVLRRRGLFDLVTFARLLSEIRRIRPGTVHATLYIANLFGGWAARLAGVPRIIVSQRGLGIDPTHSRLKRATHAVLNVFIGLISDVRVVNSRAIADRMAIYGWEACHVIHNGIIDRPFPSESRMAELRLEFGIPEKSLILASVSRIDPKKDLETLLRSFRLILSRRPTAYLLIAGGGFADYQTHLESVADTLGVADHVKFLGFRDDVYDILALCHVSLLSSLTEGLPNAILESMLLGKPVVSTNVGGIPELISDGVEGHLVQTGDCETFANRVLSLASSPSRIGEMGLFGRTRALREFSVENTVKKTTDLYHPHQDAEGPSSYPMTGRPDQSWATQHAEWAKLA